MKITVTKSDVKSLQPISNKSIPILANIYYRNGHLEATNKCLMARVPVQVEDGENEQKVEQFILTPGIVAFLTSPPGTRIRFTPSIEVTQIKDEEEEKKDNKVFKIKVTNEAGTEATFISTLGKTDIPRDLITEHLKEYEGKPSINIKFNLSVLSKLGKLAQDENKNEKIELHLPAESSKFFLPSDKPITIKSVNRCDGCGEAEAIMGSIVSTDENHREKLLNDIYDLASKIFTETQKKRATEEKEDDITPGKIFDMICVWGGLK